MTNLLSEGFGVVLDLSELEAILASISNATEVWSAELHESHDHSSTVNINYASSDVDADLTTAGISFPVIIDRFPWLTSEPLVLLHPSLAETIEKPDVQQADSMADFGVIWTPIREALTIESLRGAARIFSNLSEQRRSLHVS